MENKIRFIAKVDLKKTSQTVGIPFLVLDNFDWLGRPKSVEIEEFIDQPFDRID